MRRATILSALLVASPALGQSGSYGAVRAVPDPDLATMTGKFVLPNGAEVALSVVSDAAVDGRAVLRTVLTIDRTVDLKVFARPVGATAADGNEASTSAATAGRVAVPTAAAPGFAVTFDRQSGVRVEGATGSQIAPAVSVTGGGTPRDAAADAAARGLSAVTLVPGAPAVATADGTVSLNQAANGAVVALAGDRFGVLQLLGRSIATATTNTADNRALSSVTDVSIDLRDVTPYTTGGAMMRVDALALDATARMIR